MARQATRPHSRRGTTCQIDWTGIFLADPERRSSDETASTLSVEHGTTCWKFNTFYKPVGISGTETLTKTQLPSHFSQLLHAMPSLI